MNFCLKKKLASLYSLCTIIAKEGFCVFAKIVPSAVKWIFKKDITSKKLKITVCEREEYTNLYFHKLKSETTENNTAILFLHGDHSHLCTLLPLIETAQEKNCAVYSLALPFDPTYSEGTKKFINGALKEIRTKNKEIKITMVGHSKGGFQSAFTAFCEEDNAVNAVITIAGRVQCLDNDTSCQPLLKSPINRVQTAIQNKPALPIYQIIPENDWMMPISAIQIRKKSSVIIPQAMHLNVLYKQDTKIAFEKYLDEIIEINNLD